MPEETAMGGGWNYLPEYASDLEVVRTQLVDVSGSEAPDTYVVTIHNFASVALSADFYVICVS